MWEDPALRRLHVGPQYVTCFHSNLYTLEGGVHNYLREEGGDLWNGSLFVFDGRMAVPAPGACRPLVLVS